MKVLLGERLQKEQEELKKDLTIVGIVADLILDGVDPRSVDFKNFNNRYYELTGKHCKTIGSVKTAAVSMYNEIQRGEWK